MQQSQLPLTLDEPSDDQLMQEAFKKLVPELRHRGFSSVVSYAPVRRCLEIMARIQRQKINQIRGAKPWER